MAQIELSQQELLLIITHMSRSVESGGLKLGDVFNIAPIVQKLDALIEKPDEGKITEPN